MTAKVFIDGQAGTTGIEISERLRQRPDIELLSVAEAKRKDPSARARLFDQADIAILCLPDDAAREAVALAEGRCRLLDASTAHRTADGWTYGLPELTPNQAGAIAGADRVSNPGCYPQGFILCIRPLVDAGLLSPQANLTLHAISGYSGGGRKMIEAYEAADPGQRDQWGTRPYALSLRHKHLPEMQRYSGLAAPPLFSPTVGTFRKGMVTMVPLFEEQLEGGAQAADVVDAVARAYRDSPFVAVSPYGDCPGLEGGYLSPCGCNDTNRMEISLFGNERQLLLAARYDNLGKGAAGAAVQNLNLMLGCEETRGLA